MHILKIVQIITRQINSDYTYSANSLCDFKRCEITSNFSSSKQPLRSIFNLTHTSHLAKRFRYKNIATQIVNSGNYVHVTHTVVVKSVAKQ